MCCKYIFYGENCRIFGRIFRKIKKKFAKKYENIQFGLKRYFRGLSIVTKTPRR